MPLFGKSPPEELPETLRQLLAEVKVDRVELEKLLARVNEAAARVPSVEEPLRVAVGRATEIASRLAELERRASDLSGVAERLEAVARQSESLARRQTEAEQHVSRVMQASGETERAVGDLRGSLEAAGRLRADLAALVGPEGPVATLKRQADGLHEQFLGQQHDVGAVRDDQAALRGSQQEALGRFEELRERWTHVNDDVGEIATRVSRMEATLGELAKTQELAGRIQDDLSQLSSLSDVVMQKVAALEKQREVVDRAAAQAARLDDLVWDLDTRLKKAQEESKLIRKTQTGLTELEELYRRVDARLGQTRTLSREADAAGDALARKLGELKRGIEDGLARFALDRQAVEAVSRQVVDLRGTLVEFERRAQQMQGTTQAVAQAQARADELTARLTTVTTEVARVEERAETLRAMRRALEEAEGQAGRLSERVQQLESAQPGVQELARELAGLRGAREEVRAGTEQLREVRAEVERAQASQASVRGWLAGVEEGMEQLRSRIGAVEALSAQVERVRQDAEKALVASRDLTASRQFVDELGQRLGTLGTMSTDLDQRLQSLEQRRTELNDFEMRMASLKERLEDADRRFAAIGRRSREVEDIERRLVQVAATAERAEQQANAVVQAADVARERATELETLAGRVEHMGRDLEQRERTLAVASEHLAQAGTLRQQLAEAVQGLEERSSQLTASLTAADAQASRIGQFAEQLEARAGTLRFAEKRLAQFEDKMVQLEAAERELETSIHSLTARQGSVDAVRAELTRLFEMAAHAVDDVRAVAAAQQDVQTARQAFETVLARAGEADELAGRVGQRLAAIEEAERRMARLDALLSDVRTSLEGLHGQKVLVDHVIEKSGQLGFQLKESEAMLAALREERDLAARLHVGMVELRTERRQQAG